MSETETSETLVPVATVADIFRIGARGAQALCETHGVLGAGGLADLGQLLRALDLPEDLLSQSGAGGPVFLTVDEVAAELGVSPRTIRNYGNGQARPARFPRPIALSPRQSRFLARDVQAMIYHVVGVGMPDPVVVAGADAEDSAVGVPSDVFVLSQDLDDLIPAAPRPKRQRKK